MAQGSEDTRIRYLERRRTHFLLWSPSPVSSTPRLVIGTFAPGTPPEVVGTRILPLRPSLGEMGGELYELSATECGLEDGRVYHYWFEVADTDPYRPPEERATLLVTDPAAWSVDWRLLAKPPSNYDDSNRQPAAVVRFSRGELRPADPDSPVLSFEEEPDSPARTLPPNNRLVIYELPCAWTRRGHRVDGSKVGVGSFKDVLAMLECDAPGANFRGVEALVEGRAHLLELGANALELLPPADSFEDRTKWGYGTTNYFAPDFDLGLPIGQDSPTAIADLIALVRTCHRNGIRFILDVVMAFAKRAPLRHSHYSDYFVQFGSAPKDPEQQDREGFGGDLWKYAWRRTLWDPLTGEKREGISPARQYHKLHVRHWISFFHVDGLRLDSLNNVRNYDFISEFREEARRSWRERWASENSSDEGRDNRFLVVGEDLSVPQDLLSRVDGLWNEHFRRRARNALLGRNTPGVASFEQSVMEMIDCRLLGFKDGSQVVNYLGSHDVTNPDQDGTNNDRLFNFLDRFGIEEKEERMKLGFACLLTAVGIPMIFAGDEFGDRMDVDLEDARRDDMKQSDALNLDRLQDPWRRRLFDYVSRLVKFRTASDALATNDTEFLHSDFEAGKRVMVWRRGALDLPQVVVVANFSSFATDVSEAGAEYRVPRWPETPKGRRWREVTQDRRVPEEWVGREPLFPWEAKIYTLEEA